MIKWILSNDLSIYMTSIFILWFTAVLAVDKDASVILRRMGANAVVVSIISMISVLNVIAGSNKTFNLIS